MRIAGRCARQTFGRLRQSLQAARSTLEVALLRPRKRRSGPAARVSYSSKLAATALKVRLDLDIPADRVFPAELDLIEAHYRDVLMQFLQMDDESVAQEEQDGRRTLRPRLDHSTG